jgi:YD repeat-containing protein
MAITYILQSITDITGGLTQIFYEPNDYGTSNTVVGGFRVNKISRTNVSTGETLSRTYYYKDANGYSTGEVYGTFYNQLSFAFGNAGLYFSESPYITTDVNGVFDGYSMVKVTNPDGGNTVYTFTNFNDAPNPPGLNDIFNYQMPGTSAYPFFFASSTSQAYKRGLLKDQLSSTASGNPVSEVTNTYTSQTTPGQAAKAFRPFNMGAVVGGNGGSQRGFGAYYSITDNYRLSQTVRTDYDQVTPTNKTLRTTAYTYSAANHRLVLTATTTDSKAQTLQQTYYYADDGANDTYVTAGSAEQQALSTMATANRVNVVIDETDSRNGSTRRVHNLYSTVSTGLANNIYLTATNTYVGGTLAKQQNFTYDPSSSQLIDVSAPGDKTTAMYYDYNTTYPVAKIVNASWSATYTAYQSSTTTYIMNIPGSLNFTTAYIGPIQLHLLGSGAVNYNLSGPVYLNSVLCNGATGGCGAYSPSYTINNAGVGTYSLSVTNASGSGMPPEVGVTYPSISTSYSVSKEFFYEGFEQNSANTKGGAHTGNMYYPIDYYPNYTPPDSRSYTIQWWGLVNGKWIFNEQPYATGMTLPGPVDDVRIFPSDAQMTTYTYNPLVGKTSEIDPAGRATTYEYDFLGRLLRVRDQDGNILKQYDYQYQVPLHQ